MTNVSSANATGLPAASPSTPSPRRTAKAPPSRRRSRKTFAPLLEAPAAPVPEDPVYRALTLFQHVPVGCEAHLVHHDCFAPHIKAGEFVVVDTTDRVPAAGEIFLVRIDSSREPEGFLRRLVQLWRPSPLWNCADSWMLCFSIRRFYGHKLTREEIIEKMRAGEVTVSDGPLNDRRMREKIIGRVVGVMLPGEVR